MKRYVVGAYTGVAASNIGLGARTLTDLFRLAKINEASGEILPLQGDDLKAFVQDMKDLDLLIVDEISMVSRVVLSQIHTRLREWRLATHRSDLAEQEFGGLAVILAGDFGQLPPVAVSPNSLVSAGAMDTSSGFDAAPNMFCRMLHDITAKMARKV